MAIYRFLLAGLIVLLALSTVPTAQAAPHNGYPAGVPELPLAYDPGVSSNTLGAEFQAIWQGADGIDFPALTQIHVTALANPGTGMSWGDQQNLAFGGSYGFRLSRHWFLGPGIDAIITRDTYRWDDAEHDRKVMPYAVLQYQGEGHGSQYNLHLQTGYVRGFTSKTGGFNAKGAIQGVYPGTGTHYLGVRWQLQFGFQQLGDEEYKLDGKQLFYFDKKSSGNVIAAFQVDTSVGPDIFLAPGVELGYRANSDDIQWRGVQATRTASALSGLATLELCKAFGSWSFFSKLAYGVEGKTMSGDIFVPATSATRNTGRFIIGLQLNLQ